MDVLSIVAFLLAICSPCFANNGVKVNVSMNTVMAILLLQCFLGIRNRICDTIHYSDSIL